MFPALLVILAGTSTAARVPLPVPDGGTPYEPDKTPRVDYRQPRTPANRVTRREFGVSRRLKVGAVDKRLRLVSESTYTVPSRVLVDGTITGGGWGEDYFVVRGLRAGRDQAGLGRVLRPDRR